MAPSTDHWPLALCVVCLMSACSRGALAACASSSGCCQPGAYHFIMDTSESIQLQTVKRVKDSILKLIDTTDAQAGGSKYYISTFAKTVKPITNVWVNAAVAKDALQRFSPRLSAGTYTACALKDSAVNLAKTDAGIVNLTKVVVLYTDGVPRPANTGGCQPICSASGTCPAADVVKRLAKLVSVGVDRPAWTFLRRVASLDSSGKALTVPVTDFASLKRILTGIATVACPCTPVTCASQGKNCGTINDGCGATLQCGACTGNDECRDNVCTCNPVTCASQGKNCGVINDGCGATLQCGACNGNDQCCDNVCTCNPVTCASQGKNCGEINDGCGATLQCGACTGNNQCRDNVCACTPITCANKNCGTIDDGCGNMLPCGTCSEGEQCSQNNVCIVCEPECPKSPNLITEPPVVLPNRCDCGSFFLCDMGTPILMPCPTGLHFNAVLQVCDWPETAGCTV